MLSAAKEKGKWGIGVDADQGYIGSHVLTSALKKVNSAVFSSIQLVKAGTFKGGTDTLFNVKNSGVGYGKLSSKAPSTLKAKLDAVAQEDRSGPDQDRPQDLDGFWRGGQASMACPPSGRRLRIAGGRYHSYP